MKFKGTWVLALLAIALGLYVYLIEFKKAAKDEEQKAEDEKVIAFDASKVKTLTIKNSHGEFVLEKDGANWKLTKPLADSADSQTVNSMVTELSGEKFDQTIDEEDPKKFGLDNPSINLTVILADGATKNVAVGSDAALSGKIYLQRAGEKKILFANSSFKTQLDKTIKDFRDKKIFRRSKDEIEHFALKVNVKDNRGQVGLTKKDGTWTVDGTGEKADGDVVSSLLTSLDGLRAAEFPSEKASDPAEQKKYGLNIPAVDLTLEGKDKAQLGHILMSPKKDKDANIYIMVEGNPTVYQLYNSTLDTFTKKSQDFRDKKLPFDFKKDDVSELFVKTSLSEVHLVKKGSSWELPLPDTQKQVSQIQVSSFIDKMAGLKVAEYLDSEKPKGLAPAVGHVELKNGKGEIIFNFSWGERSKNQRNYFAKTDKYKGNFSVDASTIDGIPVQTLVESKATPTPAATVSVAPTAKSSP